MVTTTKTTLDKEALEEFVQRLRGEIVTAEDASYDEVREIWNGMIDKRPALFVRCAGAADVVQALKFAREQGLPIAVRGAGHNIAGSSLVDGGLVIDLSLLRSVRVDPAARRATVEPGATLADIDHETQAFGLATPLGINSTTGISGLTLGGGFGWLSRKYGLTIDNLISADVVTAEGELVRASADENADLFWAIRGGGGNFGIVTSFEFQLHQVGPDLLSGLIVFPLDQAKSVLTQYRKFVETMPNELNVWAVARQAPPLPFLAPEVHGKEVLVVPIIYAGDPAEGEKLIEPIRGFGTPYGEHIGVQPYTAWQQAFDPLLAPGARNYWKSHNFAKIEDGFIDTLIEYAWNLPTPQCEIFLGALGGEAGKPAPDATAYSHRDAKFVMNVHGRWDTAEEDERGIAWAREFFAKTTPYATGGVYVNFLTEDEADRSDAAYGSNYERLAELKAKYDPDNLFQVNQNITPKQ